MNYRRFFSIDVLGGILWVWSMVLIGYSPGSAIPNVDRHIHIVILILILLSILPGIIGVLPHRGQKAERTVAAQPGEE